MLDFDDKTRIEIGDHTQALLEEYYKHTKKLPVSAEWSIPEIKKFTSTLDLEKGNDPKEVIGHVIEGLTKYAVHTPHPNYFGLFNPRPGFSSILGDYITATLNPQLAAWSHAPYANEVEYLIIQEFGKKFGYQMESTEGVFCSGGAESNLTGVICALTEKFPQYGNNGIAGIVKKPIIYCSTESHHSIEKAVKIVGLGKDAVTQIPVNKELQLDHGLLSKQIRTDRENGLHPTMIFGTAGTTGSGAIDNLIELSSIAKKEQLWFHVDAAYGGAIIISGLYKKALSGIEISDSITLDLHKWFSVPMGSSIFLTKSKNILHKSFNVSTDYMPEDGDPLKVRDGYINSVQWSRRFIGLKFYLPLAIHGWHYYEQVINHHVQIAQLLKDQLMKTGWKIKNDSLLPIICFSHDCFKENSDVKKFVEFINNSGKAWVSAYPIRDENTIRACVTNYATTETEIDEFVTFINILREKFDQNNVEF